MAVSVAHCPIDLSAEQILGFILRLPASSYPALLDSCRQRNYGLYEERHLIAAYNPSLCFQSIGEEIYEFSRLQERILRGRPMDRLDELLKERMPTIAEDGETPPVPCAHGAAIGIFSYDLGRRFENLPSTARTNHFAPDLFACFYNTVIVHDYSTEETRLICIDQQGNAGAHLQKAKEEIARASLRLPAFLPEIGQNKAFSYSSNFTRESYIRAVRKIKDYIRDGDIYQANLTQQFRIEIEGLAPEAIFLRLRSKFPVPFAAFVKTPDWSVVSASPERFVRRRGSAVEAYPIKGTRPRGAAPDEDAKLAEELLRSEKDIAENIMIVDLMRNDLGKVSEIGSIDASELLSLQALPTVFHLASKVSGRLRSDATFGKLMAAVFPAGSITGAPKLRAMEIIEEIEKVRRGLSMGSIGWIGYNGDLDLNVAIRTLFITEGVGYLNAGGGIVADSDPEDEYEESCLKARTIFQAIGVDEII